MRKDTPTLDQTHKLYEQGQFQSAAVMCSLLLESPDCISEPSVLLLLGACSYALRDLHQCVECNKRALALNPEFAEAYSNLANAVRELGQADVAIEIYKRAIALNPRLVEAMSNLASAYVGLGKQTEAIDAYRRVLAVNPNLWEAHCNLGQLLRASGDREGARHSLTAAIRLQPTYARAWTTLAAVLRGLSDMPAAVVCLREVVRLTPSSADAHLQLGVALQEGGWHEEAMGCLSTAVSADPSNAQALCALANLHADWRQHAPAAQAYRRALELDPNLDEAWHRLGLTLRDLGDTDGAIGAFRSALRLRPNHQHACNHLGNALRERGAGIEALLCFEQAIQMHPSLATAHSNLASLVKEQQPHLLHIAVRHYFEAIRLDPYFADAYSNLGSAYREAGLFDEAIRMYLAAVSLKPDMADTHAHLASTFKDTGRIVEAVTHYRKSLHLKPGSPDALCNLVHTYIFTADWREYELNMKLLEQCLDTQLAQGALPAVQPFHAFVYPIHLGKVKQLACAYAKRAEQVAQALITHKKPTDGTLLPPYAHPDRDPTLGTQPVAEEARAGGGRLKIGYVSSDCVNHPLAHLMQSVFTFHDRSRFEVHIYSLRPSDDSVHRKQIEKDAEYFHEVSHLDFVTIASRIASDGIHVLVNLNGYTKGARNEIFALRPCAIQMLYMGFPGTMGADFLDYLVTDAVVSPPELEWAYHEKLLRMPHSYFVNDHRQSFNGPHCGIVPPEAISHFWVRASGTAARGFVSVSGGGSVSGGSGSGGGGGGSGGGGSGDGADEWPPCEHPPLASYEWYQSHGYGHMLGVREALRSRYGLPPFALLFCCFNQLYKLDPETFSAWCRILRSVPNSVLWLLRFPALAVPHINEALAKEGLAPERIVWMDVAEKAPYIARGSLADLFLDTPRCNGHTTGTDILWAGVPVLTCALESMCSRVAASLCHALDCPEMVAADMEAYVRLGVQLGNERASLLALRRKLWTQRLAAPLFDTRLWVKEWEDSLLAVWQRHCDGKAPDHLDIAPVSEEVAAEVAASNAADAVERTRKAHQNQQPPHAAVENYQYLAGLQPPAGSAHAQQPATTNPAAAIASAPALAGGVLPNHGQPPAQQPFAVPPPPRPLGGPQGGAAAQGGAQMLQPMPQAAQAAQNLQQQQQQQHAGMPGMPGQQPVLGVGVRGDAAWGGPAGSPAGVLVAPGNVAGAVAVGSPVVHGTLQPGLMAPPSAVPHMSNGLQPNGMMMQHAAGGNALIRAVAPGPLAPPMGGYTGMQPPAGLMSPNGLVGPTVLGAVAVGAHGAVVPAMAYGGRWGAGGHGLSMAMGRLPGLPTQGFPSAQAVPVNGPLGAGAVGQAPNHLHMQPAGAHMFNVHAPQPPPLFLAGGAPPMPTMPLQHQPPPMHMQAQNMASMVMHVQQQAVQQQQAAQQQAAQQQAAQQHHLAIHPGGSATGFPFPSMMNGAAFNPAAACQPQVAHPVLHPVHQSQPWALAPAAAMPGVAMTAQVGLHRPPSMRSNMDWEPHVS